MVSSGEGRVEHLKRGRTKRAPVKTEKKAPLIKEEKERDGPGNRAGQGGKKSTEIK